MSSISENIASHYLHMSMKNFVVAEESEEFGGIKIAVCIFFRQPTQVHRACTGAEIRQELSCTCVG